MSQRSAPAAVKVRPGSASPTLQRKCACGRGASSLVGDCPDCQRKKALRLQKKRLLVGATDDPLEHEADRVADQVLAAPAHAAVGAASIHVPRRPVEISGEAEPAPASVERMLAGSGAPLEPPLRQDMERRFGYDFSRVRVYSGAGAAESARDVNAAAYAVGQNIVFGDGRFAPASREGRRLIAHELTHVVQQSGSPAAAHAGTSPYVARAPQGGAGDAQDRAQRLQRIFTAQSSLEEVMAIIESIRPSDSASGLYVLARGADVLTITQDEYNKIRAAATKTVMDGLRKVRDRADAATSQYEAQHKIDEDQWIVSHTVRFFGGIKEPGEAVRQNVRFATANANAAQAMLEHGHLVRAAEFLAKSETFAATAKKTSQAYVDNVISTAGTTVTVLEVTAGVALATVVVIGVVLAAPAIAAAAQAAPLVITLGTAAVPAAAPVAVAETAAIVVPAAVAAAAPATAAVAVPAAAAVAVSTTAAVAIPATAAVAVPAAAASSTISTAALATAGVALASTTLSSDSPKPAEAEKDKKDKKIDACQAALSLRPGINARWHRQRGPIAGHTTVSSAAFRLDGGITPPAGQDTTQPSRDWVRGIGRSSDDAGHVIGNRFGGRADFNAADGNIFPQDLSFNRGTMRSYDAVIAGLHQRGCDVCALIALAYDSPTDLRPSGAWYTFLYRSVGASGFNPPVAAYVPNR